MSRVGSMSLAALVTAGAVACSDTPTPAGPDSAAWIASQSHKGGDVTTIDVPGATGTLALDINASGVIVGRYKADGATHGFVRRRTGEIETIDYPGASFTVAAGINDAGEISGQYALPDAPDERHGYLLRNGQFTPLDPPGSLFTNALGINGRGDVTGRFCTDACDYFHGFLLRHGTFTTVDYPGAVETNLWRSNNEGAMVGGYSDADGNGHLFVAFWNQFTTLPLPNNAQVSMDNGDINARGDIVGTYCDGEPPCSIGPDGTHGFRLSGPRHVFSSIDVPGATATSALGTNDRGDIVGGYFDADNVLHGFVKTSRSGEGPATR
jgi:uncharacterized membrane protein